MSKLYNQLLKELDTEDTAEQNKTVYAAFGAAVFHAQLLEKSFQNLLITKSLANSEIKTQDQAKALIDKIDQSKKTMGNLLFEVKKEYIISDDDFDELKSLLEIRNYLTHKYFKENPNKFYTLAGKMEMLRYFSNFIERYKIIDNRLEQYDKHYKEKIGITDEWVEEQIEEMKKEELERLRSIKNDT